MIGRISLFLYVVIGFLGSEGERAVFAASSKPTAWQVDVTFHDPRGISVQLPGDTAPTRYWYMVYEVTNNTGKDRPFYPSFRVVTDTLQVVEGDAHISPRVYDVIIARHQREFPFLAPPTKVTGPLLQGRANARASVVVFRDFDPQANRFTIFAGGFSGKVERRANPAFSASQKESSTNPRQFILRRTLAIQYDLPGDPQTRVRAKPIRRTRKWVMR